METTIGYIGFRVEGLNSLKGFYRGLYRGQL